MNLKKCLFKEHSGFAATLEYMLTLVTLTYFFIIIMFSLRVMNVQRYINTVAISSLTEAARWGGWQTLTYKKHTGGSVSLKDNLISALGANNRTSVFIPEINDYDIMLTFGSGDPAITETNSVVSLTLSYQLPGFFGAISSFYIGHDINLFNFSGYGNGGRHSITYTTQSLVAYSILL